MKMKEMPGFGQSYDGGCDLEPDVVPIRDILTLDECPMVVYYGVLIGSRRDVAANGIEPPFFFQLRKLRERFGTEENFKKKYHKSSMERKAYEVASGAFPRYRYPGFEKELNLSVFGVPISLDLDYAARHARAAESSLMGGLVLAVEVDKPFSRIESICEDDGDTRLLMQGVINLDHKLIGVYYTRRAVAVLDEIVATFGKFNTDISPLEEVSPISNQFP